MYSFLTSIVLICTLLTVEARRFKKQDTALLQLSEGSTAASHCGEWVQLQTKCTGSAPVSETGKSESECKQWCESQGPGCCETRTTGECIFVSGDGSTTWSADISDAKATFCTEQEYTMIRMGDGCDYLNVDKDGFVNSPGTFPTEEPCQDLCTASADCNFYNWGGISCHLYRTCNGSITGFHKVLYKEPVDLCSNVTCDAANACHAAGVCDSQAGVCSNPTVDDGSTCSAGGDECNAGFCTAPEAGATGDPHFVGFDGSRYDFQGVPGSVFNLITDEAFQLNARFVESPADGKTYMGTVAAKVGSNEVVITPDVVVVNNHSVAKGEHVYLYDGEESLGLLIVDEHRIHVKALSFQVTIIISQEGEFVYLDVNAAANSDHLVHPHGILGQTARYLVDGSQPQPVRFSHKNLYASGFLAGSPDDYIVADGLLGTHFSFNRFGVNASTAKIQVSRRFGFGRVLYQKQA